MAPLLEVCIDSVDSAVAAEQGGGRRVELCSALELGGLTPGIGLVRATCQAVGLPVMAMVRPRGGSFAYSPREIETMLREVDALKDSGAAGVVFGALTRDAALDLESCRRLVEAAGPLDVTFHRAFDEVSEPLSALDALIDLGVNRLLTSGQQPTAEAGIPLIRELVSRAAGRLQVMAGAGVRPENAARIVDETGVTEIHGTASEPQEDAHGHPPRTVTSAATVRRLVASMAD